MRHFIFHNFWLKVFSVALATVIWLAIYHGIQNDVTPAQTILNRLVARQYLRVPVTIIKLPGDSRIFKLTPDAVIVSIAGDDLDSRRIASSDLRAFVDVTQVPSGTSFMAPVRAEAPSGETVQDVRPANVLVEQNPPPPPHRCGQRCRHRNRVNMSQSKENIWHRWCSRHRQHRTGHRRNRPQTRPGRCARF